MVYGLRFITVCGFGQTGLNIRLNGSVDSVWTPYKGGLCYSTFKIQLYWIIFPTPGPHRTHFSNGCDAPSSIVFCHSIYFMEAELAASASFKNIDCRPKLANEACFSQRVLLLSANLNIFQSYRFF